MFLKKFRNIHRSLSLLIKLHSSSLQFIEKDTPAQVFSYELYKVFNNTYFVDHVQLAASRNYAHNNELLKSLKDMAIEIAIK